MIEQQKYRRLAERLDGDNAQGLEKEATFYFQQLQRLEIDLLVAEIEVGEQQRQIAALENKIGNVQAEHHKTDSQNRRIVESSSQEVMKEYACPLKDCGKHFQKQSDLALHGKLAHSPDHAWLQPSLFRLELQQEQ